MKKSILTLAAFAAVILGACTRIEPQQPSAADGLTKVTLTARSGDDATKSSRDAAGHFYWSPDDAVSLFRTGATEGNWRLSTSITEPASSANFSGEVPTSVLEGSGKYWAVYPYDETNTFDGSSVTLTVPASQTAAEGTFADGQFISIGCSDDLSMTFYHLCGGFKFRLEQSGITSVTLSGRSGEVLAGKVKVALDASGHPVVQQVVNSATSITLTGPDGGAFKPGVEYFFVTLPVNISQGITIDFGGGLTRNVDVQMSINRAKFQWSSNALDSKIDGIVYEAFDIENNGTKAYMAAVDYSDDPGYTRSDVKNNQYYSAASDLPKVIEITWDGGTASSVELSTSPLFTNTFAPYKITGSKAQIYNLIPGVKYYYRVKAGNGSVLKLGCVTPTGQVRMINCFNSNSGKVYNVRDFGGWEVPGGKHIAYGKLYRGSELDKISTEGKNLFLNTLGITADLDLRGYKSSEAYAKEVLDKNKVAYSQIHVQKFFGVGTGVTQKLYKEAIRQTITWLDNGKVIYMHCAGGADRTGTLAFLIEALLGVNESDLSKDYELTTFDKTHNRYRNATSNPQSSLFNDYRLTDLVFFLRNGNYGDPATTSINELVYNWATSTTVNDSSTEGIDKLTPEEITRLRELLLVDD